MHSLCDFDPDICLLRALRMEYLFFASHAQLSRDISCDPAPYEIYECLLTIRFFVKVYLQMTSDHALVSLIHEKIINAYILVASFLLRFISR